MGAQKFDVAGPNGIGLLRDRDDGIGAIAHREDFVFGDGDAGEAAPKARRLPHERRPVLRPLFQQPGLGADVIAIRPAPLRPIRSGNEASRDQSHGEHQPASRKTPT